MAMIRDGQLAALAERWSTGEEAAFDQLVELLYDDLRALAHRHLEGERRGHTLSTTALVNEAYVELAGRSGTAWQGRPQLLALTSRIMRHVLVDHARRRRSLKRGGDAIVVPLNESEPGADPAVVDLLELEQAMERLEARDERLARIVEYRFYGGMTERDIAALLGVSQRTVRRDWALARAYLFQLLGPQDPVAGPA